MRSTTRLLSLLLVVVLAGALAVGCAGTDAETDAETDATTAPAATEPADEPTDAEPTETSDDDTAPDGDDAAAATPAANAGASPAKPVASRPTGTKPAPAKPAPAKPAPAQPAPALPDGAHQGRVTSITSTTVTLQLARMLTGQAAVDAARADGHADWELDFYVQDLGRSATVPLAGDGGFRLIDCSAGCTEVGTTLDALVSGAAKPYGGAQALFDVRVDAGAVVSLAEIYLP